MNELKVKNNDRSCIASKLPELLTNLLLNMGFSIPEIRQCPYYLDNSASFYMINLKTINNGVIPSKDITEQIKHHKYLFFADCSKFVRQEGNLGSLIPLPLDDNDERCLAARSPKPLLNLLLDMDLEKTDIRECPYLKDISDRFYMLKTKDISDGTNRIEEITIKMKRHDSVFFADISQFNGDLDWKVGSGIIDKLAPSKKIRGHYYSTLLFWCKGEFYFNNTLDILFKLDVKKIYAAKLQLGEDRIYLVRASEIESPIILSKFTRSSNVIIFYPVPSNPDIWMEWGSRYDFAKSSQYDIFKPDAGKSVFLFGEGYKVLADRLDFTRLLRFMDLNFETGTKTPLLGDSRTFGETEFDYTLRLKRNTWRNWGKQELDDLLREEKEIQDRIEWLKEIESIFEGHTTHRVLFYPFSASLRDPVFPRYFFRNHSLNQLRKLNFYYGNIGTLGDGVLVSGKHFLNNPQQTGYEIAKKVYPREGIVFESCGDWCSLAGLRVLRPEGLDLFPYLEVEKEDRSKIVQAFLDTVVQRNPQTEEIFQVDPEEAKKIQDNPDKYLYFLFPKQITDTPDLESRQLEGVIIHEDKFKDFDIKIVNLGIHFSRTNEEKNISNKSYKNSVVENFTGRFKESIDIIHNQLEKAFQRERATLKEKITKFLNAVEGKEKVLTEQLKKIDESLEKITVKEPIVAGFQNFLEKCIKEYSDLLTKSSSEFMNFGKEISSFMHKLNRDIDAMFKDNAKEYTSQIEFLKEFEKHSKDTQENINHLIEKRNVSKNSLESLEKADKEFTAEFENSKFNCLKVEQKTKAIWDLNDAFQSLNSHLDLMEKHIANVKMKSERGSVYSVSPDPNHFINQWFYDTSHKITLLRENWAHKSPGNEDTLHKIFHNCKDSIHQCFRDLEISMNTMKNWEACEQHKKIYYKNIAEYIPRIETTIEKLNEILEQNKIRYKRSLWKRLFRKY